MRRALSHARPTTTILAPRPRPRPTPIAAVDIRPFTSSSPRSFFFRRPTVSPTQIVQDLTNAVNDGRPDIVAKLYPSLVDAFQKSSSPSSSSSSPSSEPLVSHRKLQSFMRTLARSNRFPLVLKMFQDLPSTFNYSPSALDHHLVIMAFCTSGKMIKATRWIDSMESTHGIKPHVSDFNLVLQGWRRKRDLYEMRQLVERTMRKKHGIEPNVVTYNTFISALFEQGGRVDEVRKLREEMRQRGVEADLYTETALLTGYLDAGELASAREVQKRLGPVVMKAVKSGFVDSTKYDTAMVNALLKYEARVHGFDKAVKMTEKFRNEGVPLDSWTLNSLLVEGSQGIKTAEEGVRLLEDLEDLVELQADRRAWSAVINELARKRGGGGIDEALKLYSFARDRSIDPDTTMIHPLVESLLTPSPTPDSFSTAKSLYEDLSTSALSHDFAPEQPIYALLLNACAHPVTLDLPYSRTLISDMKRRGIKLESSTAIRHIESLMRASSSFEEAFESYDEIRALDPSIFTSTNDYNSILEAFLSLSFPSSSSTPSPTAPPPLVMEFLADMRKSSLPANSVTYSILLTYYSRTSSASIQLIEHLHSLIKLDINLDPDTALFNSLMSAYSRVGAYSQVYRIWETLLINSQHSRGSAGGGRIGPDQRSFSVFLDTCGYDRSQEAQKRARRVWNDEKGLGIKRNRKNWDTWIECLCRWGKPNLEEATRVALEEMDGKEGRPKADQASFEVLLKFARSFGVEEWEETRRRVFERRPELRESLEDVGTKSRKQLDEEKGKE
ncbi:uncharacterized protein JCM6883_007535 [Sporobolomyces salmoneus]|uniref:uncharacterized protein n=1 Tax=Sporobolomyces salmoneus TaxID=183962 RepID=UPI00316D79D9